MATGFGQRIHCIPLLAPTSYAPNASWVTEHIDLKQFTDLEFHVNVGVLASSGGTTWAVEPYCSSTTTAAGEKCGFMYCISSTAIGGDSMGSPTTASSTEYVSLTSNNSSELLIVYIDPSLVEEIGSDKRYLYLTSTFTSDDNTSSLFSVVAYGIPRHKQATMESATA